MVHCLVCDARFEVERVDQRGGHDCKTMFKQFEPQGKLNAAGGLKGPVLPHWPLNRDEDLPPLNQSLVGHLEGCAVRNWSKYGVGSMNWEITHGEGAKQDQASK